MRMRRCHRRCRRGGRRRRLGERGGQGGSLAEAAQVFLHGEQARHVGDVARCHRSAQHAAGERPQGHRQHDERAQRCEHAEPSGGDARRTFVAAAARGEEPRRVPGREGERCGDPPPLDRRQHELDAEQGALDPETERGGRRLVPDEPGHARHGERPERESARPGERKAVFRDAQDRVERHAEQRDPRQRHQPRPALGDEQQQRADDDERERRRQAAHTVALAIDGPQRRAAAHDEADDPARRVLAGRGQRKRHDHEREHAELREQQRQHVDERPVERGLQEGQAAPARERAAAGIVQGAACFVDGAAAELREPEDEREQLGENARDRARQARQVGPVHLVDVDLLGPAAVRRAAHEPGHAAGIGLGRGVVVGVLGEQEIGHLQAPIGLVGVGMQRRIGAAAGQRRDRPAGSRLVGHFPVGAMQVGSVGLGERLGQRP